MPGIINLEWLEDGSENPNNTLTDLMQVQVVILLVQLIPYMKMVLI